MQASSTCRVRKVCVADGHPIVVDALSAAFDREEGFEVVGTATEGEGGLREALEGSAELLILDPAIPREGGMEVLRRVRREDPGMKVIFYGERLRASELGEAMRLGVSAMVSKCVGSAGLIECAHQVMESRTAPMLMGFDPEPCNESLSPREREVLRLAVTGLSNKEIAAQLGVAPGTIKIHLHAIFRKLGIRRRVELTRLDA